MWYAMDIKIPMSKGTFSLDSGSEGGKANYEMQESPEDYLEAILVLSKELGNVRSIDVANYLGYSKPSISVAMKRLRENGFVALDDHGNLVLTGAGLSIALKIYEKHLVIQQFLVSIGVSEETAKKDACRMEHVISDESFERIKLISR